MTASVTDGKIFAACPTTTLPLAATRLHYCSVENRIRVKIFPQKAAEAYKFVRYRG
jgi:hypothetical protein